MKMCVVRGDSTADENEKSVSFSLPHDNDEAFPSLVPASDTSNSTSSVSSSNNEQGAKHKLFSWRHHDTNKTAVPSRAYSHSVTCARAKVPKPPLPIKAARSAMNCVHPSHSKLPQQQQDHHVPPARAQSKRSSLKQSDSSGEQHKKRFTLETWKCETMKLCSAIIPIALLVLLFQLDGTIHPLKPCR